MHRILLILSTLILVVVRATIDLHVSLQSYSNPDHLDCSGVHCEGFTIIGITDCDNRFEFCVRTTASSVCISSIQSSGDIEDDQFTFTSSVRSQLGLSDPIIFSRLAPSSSLVLEIRVYDNDDHNADDHVDTIAINIPDTVTADGPYSNVQSYRGQCGGATISLRYRIISRCDINRYGQNCATVCAPQTGQYYCNYLGQRICEGTFAGADCTNCQPNYYGDRCDIMCTATSTLSCDRNGNHVCRRGNFVAPSCTECLPYYYPRGSCHSLCTSRDDETGHYTCNSDGSRTCLRNFTGPDCLDCIADYYGVNCDIFCTPPPGNFMCNSQGVVVCSGNFTAPNCTECLPNHYGPTCATYCLARDDSLGHYTCNPDGTRNCSRNFAGPNCLDCKENYYQEECNKFCQPQTSRHRCTQEGLQVCDGNYRLPSCDICTQHYYGPNCTVYCEAQRGQYICISSEPYRLCLSNYAAPDCTECAENYYTPETGCSTFCTPRGNRVCNNDGKLVEITQETPQPNSLDTVIYVVIGIGILIVLVGCVGFTVCCCVLISSGKGMKSTNTCSDCGKGVAEDLGKSCIMCFVFILCLPCYIALNILTCGAFKFN